MKTMTRRTTLALLTGLAASSLAGTARAETTLDRIKSTKKVTVGFVNNQPWSFRNDKGEIVGIEADIIRAVLGKFGVEIETATTEFNGLIPGLQARRFDMSNGGLFITPQRCKLVAFSDPYLRVADGVIVKAGNPQNIHSYKDIADNPALRLGASRGSVNAQNAEYAGVATSRMLLLPDAQSVVSALLADRLDAATFSLGLAVALLRDPNVKGLERAMPFKGAILPNGEEKLGHAAFAFRPEDNDLRQVFSAGIAELAANGSLTTILQRYGFSANDLPSGARAEQLCQAV
ncbi:MAG: ectoine/hydroxyectoine ABC transporter substrate-binding protein EhuB [Xanthobacteraceae bacterium]